MAQLIFGIEYILTLVLLLATDRVVSGHGSFGNFDAARTESSFRNFGDAQAAGSFSNRDAVHAASPIGLFADKAALATVDAGNSFGNFARATSCNPQSLWNATAAPPARCVEFVWQFSGSRVPAVFNLVKPRDSS